MAIYKQKGSKNWWYKFNWNGALIRESTKQANKRTAENMEAAHRASLAKGEVGIREKKLAPTVQEFAKQDFLPFIESRFAAKRGTLGYYRNGVKQIVGFAPIASCRLDSVTVDKISSFISKRQARGLQVTSINRQLEVLRRMFALAAEWGKMNVAPPKVKMLSGENHRERVLSHDEEARYLAATSDVGRDLIERYERALHGLRATLRGEVPIKPEDPFLLRDVTTILLDCALRPEECFRLRWEDVRGGALHVLFGKTANARRRIPLSARVAALFAERKSNGSGEWVFPAPTMSGHVEKSTIKKQHKRARKLAKLEHFVLYTLRHTCLMRWAVMDPYTLAYLVGHSDFSTTKRYVHPQTETVLAAFERAQEAKTGHSFGHSAPKSSVVRRAGWDWRRAL
jgi:integrase